MVLTVNGVNVEKVNGKVTFEYKEVPVTITVIRAITEEDLIEMVKAEMIDMDRLFKDL